METAPQAGLVAAAVALAAAELDAASVGQFMISRPLVLGPALGAAFGKPALGMGIGLLYEVLSLDDLPVGSHMPLNPAVAAGAGLLLALGTSPVPASLAFPAGLGFGWVHARLESRLRRSRARLGPLVEGRLGRGERPGLGRLAAIELLRQWGLTFGVLLGALLLKPLLSASWPAFPAFLREGLSFAMAWSPWLAAAALLRSLRAV